jgi:hypothetical protein
MASHIPNTECRAPANKALHLTAYSLVSLRAVTGEPPWSPVTWT